jgi:predicted HicB family RNase H-like nuclease
MSKVTIYIDPETEAKASDAAKARRISLSKWIAGVIGKEVADEWPASVRNLAGASADFPD